MADATNKRRRWWLVAATICVLVALPIGIFVDHSLPGIRITIQNTGSSQMGSVVLHTTANSFPLGDIAAGGSANATIYSGRKSHLEIEFTDIDGKPKRVNAGGYFAGGMKGTIRVSIKDGVIEENDQNITLTYW